MKKLIMFILCLFFIPSILSAQLKRQDKPVQISQELVRPASDQWLGLSILDPSKFSMSHSFSMSYFSLGGRGISQGMYLNTMRYEIAPPLMLTVQWGIQNYPYNSLAKDHPVFQSGFFLSGAELKYQPTKNIEMRLQYRSMPGLYNRSLLYDPFGFPRQQSWWEDEQ